MASLFTSCPTFLLSQLRSFFLEKEDTFYPRCITIWPLYDPIRHDASVWPRAGSHIGHFCPIRILSFHCLPVTGAPSEPWWRDFSCVDERVPKNQTNKQTKKGKINHGELTKYGRSLYLWNRTVSHFSWFIVFCCRAALRLSCCVCLILKRHFFTIAFVSWQLQATRTVYRSLATQRGEVEFVMSWHLVPHKNTSLAFKPTQLQSPEEC